VVIGVLGRRSPGWRHLPATRAPILGPPSNREAGGGGSCRHRDRGSRQSSPSTNQRCSAARLCGGGSRARSSRQRKQLHALHERQCPHVSGCPGSGSRRGTGDQLCEGHAAVEVRARCPAFSLAAYGGGSRHREASAQSRLMPCIESSEQNSGFPRGDVESRTFFPSRPQEFSRAISD